MNRQIRESFTINRENLSWRVLTDKDNKKIGNLARYLQKLVQKSYFWFRQLWEPQALRRFLTIERDSVYRVRSGQESYHTYFEFTNPLIKHLTVLSNCAFLLKYIFVGTSVSFLSRSMDRKGCFNSGVWKYAAETRTGQRKAKLWASLKRGNLPIEPISKSKCANLPITERKSPEWSYSDSYCVSLSRETFNS